MTHKEKIYFWKTKEANFELNVCVLVSLCWIVVVCGDVSLIV